MTAPVNGGAPPAVSSVIRASVFNHDPQRQHFQNVVNHCHLNYSVPIYAEGKMQHMLIVEARKRLGSTTYITFWSLWGICFLLI